MEGHGGTKRTGSDQIPPFLHGLWSEPVFWSYMSRKHFSCFLHNFKSILKYQHTEKSDLGKHSLLLNKTGFRRWHQMFIQSTLDISNSDISNSAKIEASIWIKYTFWLLSPTIIVRKGLFYKSKLPEVQINLHFG